MPGSGSWWDDDPELARLRFDSALCASAQALAADAVPVRVLTFVARRLTLELEVRPEGLRGRVVPPQPGVVAVRRDDGRAASAPVDDAGRFSLTGPPCGQVRLRIDTDAGLIVLTDAITL